MAENQVPEPVETRPSLIQGLLSFLIPGLGQAVGGAWRRGLAVLVTIAAVSGLTIWTAAQRPRFPDYGLTARAFLGLLLETGALLIFLTALYYLAKRYLAREPTTQAVARVVYLLVAAFAVGLATDELLATVLPTDLHNQLFGMTAVYGAALVAGMWLWNVGDAARVRAGRAGPSRDLVLLGCLALLVLGTRVTEVDLPKAIREYKDTQIILRRIVWPWRSAFVYEEATVSAEAKVQAPCPEGATGPEPNQPREDGPWIIVTPTCGEVSVRDRRGNLEFGTLLTIEGGGFVPGEIAEIWWQNPIGNAFRPRGVGDIEIEVGPDGTFTTQLYIPDVVIPAFAEGPQIHTLRVVQPGQVVFTGELSREMKLALQEMLVTIMMGMMATFVGVVFSVPLSFLAARNLMGAIRSTLLGFLGGVAGLVLGAYLGRLVASPLAARLGGLEQAPVQTFLINAVLVGGGALLFYRLAGASLHALAERALPALVGRALAIAGAALLGAAIGYGLGVGFAHGVFGVTHTAEFAALMAPRTGAIGAAFGTLVGALYALRRGPQAEVTTGNIVYVAVRTVMNIFRSIEPLILAVIGIIWVGPGPFAGFVALTIHTIAALGKLYSESIESIDPGPIEALQATGASRLQTIVYAVVPQVLPPFIAFTIYRWDINVRLSTIIGLVGGGGIGFLLIQWIRQFQYGPAGIAVWLITITVAVLDFVSAEIRERFV